MQHVPLRPKATWYCGSILASQLYQKKRSTRPANELWVRSYTLYQLIDPDILDDYVGCLCYWSSVMRPALGPQLHSRRPPELAPLQ